MLESLFCNDESELWRSPAGVEAVDRIAAVFLSAPRLDSVRPAYSKFPPFSSFLPRLMEGEATCNGGMIVWPAMQEHNHPATAKIDSIVLNDVSLFGSFGGFILGLIQ